MKRLYLCLLVLAIAALACDVQPPDFTPSAPQLTAGALNSTYEAQATARSSVEPSTATSVTTTICPLATPGPGTNVLEVTVCP